MANVKKDILVGGSSGVLHLVDLVGKSTETMPTAGIADGSTFFAYDTGDTYYFDQSAQTWAVPTPGE